MEKTVYTSFTLFSNIELNVDLPLHKKKKKSLDYNNSFLGEYEYSSLALDREERRDEKKRLDHLKQDQTILVKFKDEDVALLLLTSLLASYEHFVYTLLYGREALTLEDVMATLNSKEIKERSKAKGDDGEGLYEKGRIDRRDSHQSRGNP
ncbi:hypothetical protein Tco_1507484 [Tanacetum coccineum]